MKQAVLLRRSKLVVPLIVLGAATYIDYASCYIVAWKEVYHRRLSASAIVFWVLLAIFHVLCLFYWALIFIRGPGHIPKFQNFNLYQSQEKGTAPVPDVFVCDEQGFPFWCSKCQNLKPDRSFHLTDLNTCVPRFDHFCLWIGTAIGRDNFIPFIKFLQSLLAYVTIVLCFAAVYTRSSLRHDHSNLPHFIVLFVLSAFGTIFTLSLLIGTVKYTFTNSTSFDEITRRQAMTYRRWLGKQRNVNSRYTWCVGKTPRVELGIRFVNIAHEGTRKVVSYTFDDNPYSNGFKVNLINMCLNKNYNVNLTRDIAGLLRLMKSSLVAIVPFAEFFIATSARDKTLASFQQNSDEFSPEFMQKMLDKIEKKEFKHALYVAPIIHDLK
ncbi:hypothetical protein METBIDRAFT_224787 [Metschnikowia bicuspidata var. bicuspidata NRRL YB-4993]|uniref:Palmitoyltransferase n=1 Tax=Metschnikowia bicuspidata var. bicuspidata NRRL YB-4993 TaxID=869754 RepID=A0A1A0H529_9ASCO|nr:hypothetical protein METBIDRAFT_224787 [Metschnikowia bicuspidata var. bicuspidata NRRL YB-4993]OBA19055.1 hypothetical protein METBIDRAFT_224787 [Metschnikowia bicuspidata var. bicuspidata NRRL YB-4993]